VTADGPAGIPADEAELRARVDRVANRISDAGGDPALITMVAVTKGFGPEVALSAARAGLVDLGENYAQELLAKGPVLADAGQAVRWHAIGRLQRNKVRQLAPLVHLWQTVDRADLAAEIAKRAPGSRVLVQVNTSGEPQKGGVEPDAAADLVARCLDLGLDVRGMMTVGRTGPPESSRQGFAALSLLADSLDLSIRSMGMSADLEVAVQEGATMVRPGSVLFGPRPVRGGGDVPGDVPATDR
jgi:pyridoxal phosphate enzyme (YggS family)